MPDLEHIIPVDLFYCLNTKLNGTLGATGNMFLVLSPSFVIKKKKTSIVPKVSYTYLKYCKIFFFLVDPGCHTYCPHPTPELQSVLSYANVPLSQSAAFTYCNNSYYSVGPTPAPSPVTPKPASTVTQANNSYG